MSKMEVPQKHGMAGDKLGCFICAVSVDNKTGKDWKGHQNLKRFAVEYMLELKEEDLRGTEEVGGDPKCKEKRKLVMCARCKDFVRQAQDLYLELLEVVKRFRAVQQVIVMDWRGGLPGEEKKWREALRRKKYKFSGDFVVRPLEPWACTQEPPETSGGNWEDDDEEMEVKSEAPSEPEVEVGEDVAGMYVERDPLGGDEDVEGDSDWEMVNESDECSGSSSSRSSSPVVEKKDKRKKKFEPTQKPDFDPKKAIIKIVGQDSVSYIPYRPTALERRQARREEEDRMGSTIKRRRRKSPATLAKEWQNQCCDICGETLPTTEITEHIRQHVGSKHLRKCPNSSCLFVFPHKFALRSHLISGSFCYNQLAKKGTLNSFWSKERYRCEKCPSVQASLKTLQTHLQDKHENVQNPEEEQQHPKPCPISGCLKKFWLSQSVEVHLALKHSRGPAEGQFCKDCGGRKRVLITEMREHLLKVHNAEEIIQCVLCSHMFPCRERLFHHAYFFHRKSEKSFKCDICKQETGNYNKWREHYMEQHGIGDKLLCDQCDYFCWHQTDLHNHGLKAHKKITCDICEEAGNGPSLEIFDKKNKLITHKARVHGKEVYKCSKCPQSFSSLYWRDEHIQIEHHGLKGPFPCPVQGCEKIFRTMCTLKKHEVVHNVNRRKFVCHECGKEVNCRNTLRQHLNNVHLGLKQFVCDTCGASFSQRGGLRRHLEVRHSQKQQGSSK